jgi:hypothetical protein
MSHPEIEGRMSVGEGNVGRERRAEEISRNREAADLFMRKRTGTNRSKLPPSSEARSSKERRSPDKSSGVQA